MIDFFKKNPTPDGQAPDEEPGGVREPAAEADPAAGAAPAEPAPDGAADEGSGGPAQPKTGWWSRLKRRLGGGEAERPEEAAPEEAVPEEAAAEAPPEPSGADDAPQAAPWAASPKASQEASPEASQEAVPEATQDAAPDDSQDGSQEVSQEASPAASQAASQDTAPAASQAAEAPEPAAGAETEPSPPAGSEPPEPPEPPYEPGPGPDEDAAAFPGEATETGYETGESDGGEPAEEPAEEPKPGLFARLKRRLAAPEPSPPDAQEPSGTPEPPEPSEPSEPLDEPGPGPAEDAAAFPEEAAETGETASGETAETGGDEPEEERKPGLFARLKRKLASTRDMLAGRLERALSIGRKIDEDVLEELEEIMITSDLGVKTTNDILATIRAQVDRKELKDAEALKKAIKARVAEMIDLPIPDPPAVKPLVLLMIGVNGVGKTTTIAKLTRRYQLEGKSVLLAAGDTFRAAAVEQLTIWAERLKAGIVSQPTGADPSAVVYDALTAAKARGADVVIIDTAGRLHTRSNLMDELKKIKRVAGKALPGAPHETILVLDANTGQNAARQAEMFHKEIGIDRLVVTKLDGTSKGGVIVSIIHEQRLPVAFIGLGEGFSDLRPFDPAGFVEAIFGGPDSGGD